MSLRQWLSTRFSAWLLSERRFASRRSRAEKKRRREGRPHLVHYFHQVGDPYADLMVEALPLLGERYDVTIIPHLVPEPADWAAPERERLIAFSRQDAERLARRVGFSYRDPGHQPAVEEVRQAEHVLAGAIANGDFLPAAREVTGRLWHGEAMDEIATGKKADAEAAKAEGRALREKLGHYLSATLFYEGEWYWGVDRLYHLETRLTDLGATKKVQPPAIFLPPHVPENRMEGASGACPVLHYYLSFRSPYTYVAAERVKALADAYGAELRLRFVLPMVMRGLPVPSAKRFYILKDAAREARFYGTPFGPVADPVGKPVELGYSLLPWAIAEGRGFEFALAFMRGAWAEGRDMGSSKELARAVEEAGLDWQTAKNLLGNEDWRAEAEENRRELLALGLWGVPCFRIGETATWGQDRLWVMEDALRGKASATVESQ